MKRRKRKKLCCLCFSMGCTNGKQGKFIDTCNFRAVKMLVGCPKSARVLTTVSRTQLLMKPRNLRGNVFLHKQYRTFINPSTGARMESKPAESLSRNESTTTSRVSINTKGTPRILNMIRIGRPSMSPKMKNHFLKSDT